MKKYTHKYRQLGRNRSDSHKKSNEDYSEDASKRLFTDAKENGVQEFKFK